MYTHSYNIQLQKCILPWYQPVFRFRDKIILAFMIHEPGHTFLFKWNNKTMHQEMYSRFLSLNVKEVGYYRQICAPSPNIYNSHVQAPTPRATLFGDRTLRGVSKDKWGHKSWNAIQQDWHLWKKMKRHQNSLFPPWKDTASRQSSARQEEGPHQKPKCLAPWSWILASRTVQK